MLIENKRAIYKFADKHAGSRIVLAEWIEKVEAAKWTNFVDVRQTFNSADYVKPFVIFNVGGNKYRIISEVVYLMKTVRIAKIGT